MLFTDFNFLFIFLPATLIFHALLSRKYVGGNYRGLPRIFLFVSTLVFYGYQHAWFLIPFFATIFFDFLWAHLISRARSTAARKRWLWCSITQNLFLLFFFKYHDFFLGKSFEPLALPPGISFYTFESLSFVIDVYRGAITAPTSVFEFFGFIGMFPRFIAGPIVRYRMMVDQFNHYQGMQISRGLLTFAKGLFLKVIFADHCATLVPLAFSAGPKTFFSAWLGVLAYSFQIYFDFSGYSLMAIGLGQCFGFTFPENFNRPYLATSLRDFWRRWHITLSSWLKDYLYLSLGGSRHGNLRTSINLMITMTLGGLWHGAAWTFIVWGIWHGVWLAVERQFLIEKKNTGIGGPATFCVVALGWVFFRSATLSDSVDLFRVLLNPFSLDVKSVRIFISTHQISTALLFIAGIYAMWWRERPLEIVTITSHSDRDIWVRSAITATLLALCVNLQPDSSLIPFLYFQF